MSVPGKLLDTWNGDIRYATQLGSIQILKPFGNRLPFDLKRLSVPVN